MAASSLRDILRRRSAKGWAVFFFLLAVCTVAGHFLSRSTLWIDVRSCIYQQVTSIGQPARYPQRTAVVLLDDDDYWSDVKAPPDPNRPPNPTTSLRESEKPPLLEGRVPTNRAYLARLVQKLDDANVGLIALDFDLRSPRPDNPDHPDDLTSYTSETKALTDAIGRACSHGRQVVLASEFNSVEKSLVEATNVYDSAKISPRCVHTGYIQLPRDIRRVPVAIHFADGTEWKPFALAAVDAVDPGAYEYVSEKKETDFPYSKFISYDAFSKASTPKALFSGREILDTDASTLTPELFNRIVLVGADWQTLALGQGPFVDRHPSPNGPLAGVLLHANYIEAALHLQDGIIKPFFEPLGEALDVALVLLISLLGMLEIHWAWKWSMVVASSIFVVVFSYTFLQTFGLFLDFFFPLIFVGLHSGYEHIEEWRHEGNHHRAQRKE